ncbi:signal peptidase I [Prochlorococcus sp. MIT 1307]|uniref:signal peptidase I n=1 Tax=Prochlorococcus sp. MIT 1307 TaxID=3096219 RepID=UPI002A766238|nr:signal peptidase I [Prochlorococcus sp. MIT 1307]
MKSSDSKSHPFWDFWGPIFLTVFLYTGIRNYIAEARYIPSGSMLPELEINDRLLIEKLTFFRRAPRRGEIVVFNSPYSFDPHLRSRKGPSTFKCALVTFPLFALLTGIGDPACDAYIKRVVAIGGDQVLINLKGEVFLNGRKTVEPYVTNFCDQLTKAFPNCKTLKARVPMGHVLVLGDNRGNSWDGRYWPGGPFLPEREILGRAIWRFWPLNRFDSLSL